MSLVPEYDSSDSETSEESTNGNEDDLNKTDNQKSVLPSAKIVLSNKLHEGGVFNNPFKAAETAEIANLEKHVKMVKTDETVKTINGKKICWNFRKGKCRFGSKCTFAHDSDIQKSNVVNMFISSDMKNYSEAESNNDNEYPQQEILSYSKLGKQKRPGLGNNIIPSKKVMKNYILHKNIGY